MWQRKEGGATNQIGNDSFSVFHVYSHLGKNPSLASSLLNSK